MTRIVFAALAVMLPLLSLPAHAQERPDWPADCKLVPVAELPMTLKTGHVVIPASANDRDLTLGIDTGGSGTSLTKAGVGHIGLPYAASLGAVVPTIGGLRLSEGNVHLRDLRIGALALSNLYIPEMDTLPGVDGLIGPDILSRYDVELDFGGKTFRLFKTHPCADRAVSWSGAYTTVPFTFTGDEHIRVRVTLDGRNMSAILDTGAGISVMSMEDANNAFGLTSNSPAVEAANPVSGLAWSGRVHAYTTTFKTLTIGGVTIAGPRIELIEGRNFLGHDFAQLVLGNDVLSRFHLYIAYRQQKLYLTGAEAH